MKVVKVKLEQLKKTFNLVKTLRAKLKECKKINAFYKEEIQSYNNKFAKGK